MRRNNERIFDSRSALAVCGSVLLALVLVQTSHALGRADDVNRLTFNRPVALPGVILSAGSYTFERPDMNRFVVQVSSRDRRTVYYSGFTVEVPRPAAMPEGQAVTFGEAPAGSAPPITAWYPIGSSSGYKLLGW